MIKLFLLIGLSVSLFAKYDNCTFKNPHYEDICKKSVKQGVSYQYANQFLLSYFKTQKFDEVSWKYLQPKYLTVHRENEKKANNTLVKYIPEIVTNLKEYKDAYDMAEKQFGVNREIIAAILMKETRLGRIQPTHDAFIVFNTIVRRIGNTTEREKWLLNMGKTNMSSIIVHCYKAKIEPKECNLPSSYAGAIGIPQFMPDSFIHTQGFQTEYADLTKMEDAIVSAAKFLNKKAGFDALIDWEKMPDIPTIEDAWYSYEFEHENASFVYESSKNGKKYDCFACSKPELDATKEIVKKIMRYNNSSNYALGVLRLAYDAHKLLNN